LRALRKLALHTQRLPRALFLEDVRCDTNERDPVGGGGFADVWKGTRNDVPSSPSMSAPEVEGEKVDAKVAIKRLRIFGPETAMKERMLKVGSMIYLVSTRQPLTVSQ
jgi:hypothetical protein